MFVLRPTGRGSTAADSTQQREQRDTHQYADQPYADQPDTDEPLRQEETCSFSIRRVEGTVVVEIHGTVTLRQWSRIDRLLTDIIDAQGNLDVLLDLWDVVSLERQAMPMIVDAARQARDHGGQLRLADRACREHRQVSW